jgi:short-subunit dehydrogenase
MKTIVIIGATSRIAEEVGRKYAEDGGKIFLIGRNINKLEAIAKDLQTRGAISVTCEALDVNDFSRHESVIDSAFSWCVSVDVVLIGHGTLPDQKQCERDMDQCLHELNTNAISTVTVSSLVANKLEEQGKGVLAVITSVAGDRGRQSNYVYGAAKGMVSIFLGGLRNRLFASGVNIIDIKPGFVDTPMTKDFDKGFLWAQPDEVAKGIIRCIQKRKSVCYLPWFWRYIMMIIKSIPESIFMRLKL